MQPVLSRNCSQDRIIHDEAPVRRRTPPSPARQLSKSCHDDIDEATDFQYHCLSDEIDIKDLSKHRFSADGLCSPSREGSRRLSISSPPSKPIRRRSNESGEFKSAYDVGNFSFYETDDEELSLPYLFKDDEDTTVPSQTRLVRCSTFPVRLGSNPYSPSAYETLSYSPEQKKKVVRHRSGPPEIIFVSLQDSPLSDDNTVISEITITEEKHSNTVPIFIKTKSYSMTSEKNSAQSPSKPIRRSFANDSTPRNASFGCLRKQPSPRMLPETTTTQGRPTKSKSGNDVACMRHVIEENSLLSSVRLLEKLFDRKR